MAKPMPPCTRDCPRRSMVCHDKEICPEWGDYQTALAAWHAAIQGAKKKEDDLRVARRTDHARQQWMKKQK